jgi:cellulose synthase/poly-beta-1,6-N-acetylglucosamine synthase-like glycosyltransferase
MIAALVFVVSSALLCYVIAGYPLLLRALRRRGARPVFRNTNTPTVSVIVAVYNGSAFLEAKLRSLLALDYPKECIEIFVVSDGSTDNTNRIAREFAGVKLLEVPRGGKCAALNAAIPQAGGEILLLTDVRQVVEPGSLRILVRNFADTQVGAVSGHLKIRDALSGESAQIDAYWRFETWIRESLSALDSIFGATGPFYAIRRAVAVRIPPDILLDDMYLPLAAFRQGYRLIVDPEAIAWDYPTNLDTEFRRKVRTLAGNYQLWSHYPWLLTPVNRMLLHFLSYKAGRLLLPWLLIAIAASTFFLPSPWREAAALPQLLVYALAAADPWLPLPLRRLSSPCHTFVVMMLAAVAALQILFVPARRLWKVTGAAPAS